MTTAAQRSERPALDLDDDEDRDELRNRYYGLLQELRVLLPGVQVLVAFLLTVPFANRFAKLDALGRALFGVALLSGFASIVAFVTPIAFHRVGDRTSRAERLHWSIRCSQAGLAALAVTLIASMVVVSRFIYSTPVSIAVAVGSIALMIGAWVVLPSTVGRRSPTARRDA